MEASRDDFIIAIRSAFLKKGTKQRFSLIVLILFSLLLLILGRFNFKAIDYVKIGLKEAVYRSSFIVSVPENYIKDIYQKIESHFIYYNEYVILKSKNEKINSEKIASQFIIEENKRLKKIIDDYVAESEEIVAKIIIDKKSPFLRSIIINKGSKDDVQIGMAVLDKEYLVGKIVEVNYSTSRALLLSDLNSKIPVSIEPGNIQSILSGTGKNNGYLQYFKEGSGVNQDDIVYTSGSGGIFKSGIPIGKVKKLDEENYSIIFFSDLSQLNFVKLVSFSTEDN